MPGLRCSSVKWLMFPEQETEETLLYSVGWVMRALLRVQSLLGIKLKNSCGWREPHVRQTYPGLSFERYP